MPNSNDLLRWETLTGALDEVRTPNRFLQDRLFGSHNTNPTDTISLDSWVGGRLMAPLVLPGTRGVSVGGVSGKFATVTLPRIRIRKPFSVSDRLHTRTPGTAIQLTRGQNQLAAMMGWINKDLEYARGMIDNTLEWLCAQVLGGSITYNPVSAEGQVLAAITIDYQRPGSLTVVLSGADLWTASTADIRKQVTDLQRISTEAGFPLDECYLGQGAADAFINNAQVNALLKPQAITVGSIDLTQKFTAQGARFIGRVFGIDWYEYSRGITDTYGNSYTLIPTNKAQFVSRQPGVFRVEYGPIEDFKAIREGKLESEVFMKSWEEEDPSCMMWAAESRPLPVLGRPEGTATMTVI